MRCTLFEPPWKRAHKYKVVKGDIFLVVLPTVSYLIMEKLKVDVSNAQFCCCSRLSTTLLDNSYFLLQSTILSSSYPC